MENPAKFDKIFEPEIEQILSLVAEIAARVLTKDKTVRENQVSEKPRNKVRNESRSISKG